MNTTFLIGNGFDVCLGLKTRYIDFYKNYYLTLPQDGLPNYLKSFRNEILQYVLDGTKKEEQVIDWSDLESALGQYSEKLEDPTEYINIVADVNNELRAYILKENVKYKIDIENAKKLVQDFIAPDGPQYLSRQARQGIKDFKGTQGSPETISFLSFNYTETLEHILALAGEPEKSLINSAGIPTQFNEVMHIHSNLSDDPAIIVGVDRPEQIANVAFRNNPDVLDVVVKPRTNEMFGNGKNADADVLLRGTNLFVLFGLSIGETDRKWWEIIGKEISKKSCRLIYFVYENPGENNPLFMGKKRRECQNKLLKAAGFSEGDYNNYRGLITIAYNTPYFHISN